MADITKIKINNTTYNIKDPNAMQTSGGTFTSSVRIQKDDPRLYIDSENMDLSKVQPSDISAYGVAIRDKSETGFVRMRAIQIAGTNVMRGQYQTVRTINGNNVWNGISFDIDPNGTRDVVVSAPLQFRNALGAEGGAWPVSLGGTGGKDSGWKTITNSSVFTANKDFDKHIYYRKIGQWVEIRGWQLKLVSNLTDSSIVLGTVDEDCKPAAPNVVMFSGTGSFASSAAPMIVAASGNIIFYKPAAYSTWTTSMAINFGGMYFVG